MTATLDVGRPDEPRGARSIRVLAADPQPLYREAVARVIRQDVRLELVAELTDGRQALAGICRLRPDVAILDVRLPQLDGGRVLRAVVRERVPTRVILLSAEVRDDATYDALAAGACGVLSKDVTAEEMGAAIRSVASGESVLAPQAQTGVARAIRIRARDDRPVLSDRERQVLVLIATGLTAPEIAHRLQLATGTVKTHMLHVYEKLAVSERAAAVAEAMRRGLLE